MEPTKKPYSNKGRTAADHLELRHQAAKLYIREGVLLKEIKRRLDVSFKTLAKWRDAGRWDELRPDLEIMNQYKACAMYLQQGLTTGEIAQKLNVRETDVRLWAQLFGWEGTRNVLQAQDVAAEVLAPFCAVLAEVLPHAKAAIEVARASYLKGLKPIVQPHELNQ